MMIMIMIKGCLSIDKRYCLGLGESFEKMLMVPTTVSDNKVREIMAVSLVHR